MLEAVNLSKTHISDGISYDALRAVDLKIGKGERAAITGRSGSGKSTLMHLLACLDEPTSGSVLLDGKDISGLSERERNVLRNEKFGFVFQQFFLNGRETVLENVALPLRIRGWRESKIRSAAKAALASVELEDKAGKRAKDLSGGEKQRVCVARALVGEPQMIFADEPTGNLDSTTGKLLEDMLFQLNAARGITLVIVTHDPDLARRCGRVVNVKDGRIETDFGAKGEVR